MIMCFAIPKYKCWSAKLHIQELTQCVRIEQVAIVLNLNKQIPILIKHNNRVCLDIKYLAFVLRQGAVLNFRATEERPDQ